MYFFQYIEEGSQPMTRSEAIKLATQLSGDERFFAVVFDKELNDYFISESDYFVDKNNLLEQAPYEVTMTFNGLHRDT